SPLFASSPPGLFHPLPAFNRRVRLVSLPPSLAKKVVSTVAVSVDLVLAKKVVSTVAVSVDLVFDRQGGGEFSITWRVGDLWSHTERGRCADISRAAVVVEGFQNGEPMAVCQLAEGVKEHRFGGGLKPVEQQWVVGQIGEFLGIGFGGVLGVDEEASRRGGRNNWSDDEEW
ncbi:unnamed protein product, partial [Closterium sp. Naga37s-1]